MNCSSCAVCLLPLLLQGCRLQARGRGREIRQCYFKLQLLNWPGLSALQTTASLWFSSTKRGKYNWNLKKLFLGYVSFPMVPSTFHVYLRKKVLSISQAACSNTQPCSSRTERFRSPCISRGLRGLCLQRLPHKGWVNGVEQKQLPVLWIRTWKYFSDEDCYRIHCCWWYFTLSFC